MSLFSALDINASGLTAQRRRIEVISSNLANANTTRTAEGTPYKRKDLVFESAPVGDGFGATLNNEIANGGEAGVEIAGIYVVGGASALPAIGRALRDAYGKRVHRSPYPSAAAAIGLASKVLRFSCLFELSACAQARIDRGFPRF